MERQLISTKKIRNIILNYSLGRNITQIATKLKITRYTARKYISYFNNSELQFSHIYDLKSMELLAALIPERNKFANSQRYLPLQIQFPIIHEQLKSQDANLRSLWKEYKVKNPDCHKYSTFVFHYHCWREKNGLSKIIKNKWKIPFIPDKDRKIFNQWKLSTNRNEWEKAVAILELHKACPITKISNKIERSRRTIIKWQKIYLEKAIEGSYVLGAKKVILLKS
jgi:transposase